MKILTILGARPQFIKAAAVSRAVRTYNKQTAQSSYGTRIEEVIVHTGQHFDANMSDVFFKELDIPQPQHNLEIAKLSHGAMTGRMLEGIEGLILREDPDWVLVYGDTNSTLAGALAAVKLHTKVAHVEAGLRSHNARMPEEINRALTDRISNLLLCPTETAMKNLDQEGFPFAATKNKVQRIENVGDVMYDAVLFYRELARQRITLEKWGLDRQRYALCTLHRQENTDDPKRLNNILDALKQIAKQIPVLMPLHPRTRQRIKSVGQQDKLDRITVLEPLPYLEMQRLQMDAYCILTDSGGLQKEAYFHRVPCITLRDETEWTETTEAKSNVLAGADEQQIVNAYGNVRDAGEYKHSAYGEGDAAEKIISSLASEGAS